MSTIPLALRREDFVQTGGYENESTDPFAESFKVEFEVTIGQKIEKGTVFAVITTAKATFDIESPTCGKITALGDSCVDDTWQYSKKYQTLTLAGAESFEIMLPHLGAIESDIEAVLGESQEEPPVGVNAEQAGGADNGSAGGPFAQTQDEPLNAIRDDSVESPAEPTDAGSIAEDDTDAEIQSSSSDSVSAQRSVPKARVLAREQGVKISEVKGTGPEDIVQASDVQKHHTGLCGSDAKPADLNTTAGERSNEIELRPSKDWINLAKIMEEGARLPTAGAEDEFDFSFLLKFIGLGRENVLLGRGLKIRAWPIISVAATQVLEREKFWRLNGYWKVHPVDRDKDTVVLYKDVNLGLSYDRGADAIIDLDKRIIKGQRLRILVLHKITHDSVFPALVRIDTLISRAHEDRIKPIDFMQCTFVVNNIGALGHKRGVSILPPGISAILNIGRIEKNGNSVLQLFFDHRMFDGSLAAHFLKSVYEETEEIVREFTMELS